MRNLIKIIAVAFILPVAALILIFTLENQKAVSLVFLGMDAPPLAVSALVLSAFLLGLVVGPFLALLRRYHLKKGKMTKKW
ncbi:DUF1049 domain-containing protein [Pseudomonas sp. NFX98]|uniref:DUF1049 domain-containing protein n=1 Tax=Pseudomonas sp. NFX98 TaxID=3399122 RepID=UPI0039FD9F41